MLLERPLQFSHTILESVVEEGDTVIDATAGRGHDTVKLCHLVGASGIVFSIDIQEDAVRSTRAAVDGLETDCDVTVIKECHSRLADILPRQHHGAVKAVCYNLGYLPGSDKSVITESESTIESLRAAASVLAPGGMISIVVYSGHEGGTEEMQAVLDWGSSLDQQTFTVYTYEIVNQINRPPMLVVIQKKS